LQYPRNASGQNTLEQSEPVIVENTNASKRDNSWCRRAFSNQTKWDLNNTFSDKIAELEKSFNPTKTVPQQTDPLYDKLKKYHDTLLRSVSNTTTEKTSAEVLDVIINPAVIDDCGRSFLWSKQDETRLNELNETCKLLESGSGWTPGCCR